MKLSPDPKVAYDYQELLSEGQCIHCGHALLWKLEVKNGDDRFCHAICCATKYSMVPEKVRVLASFAYPLEEGESEREDESVADADFLRELEKMNLYSDKSKYVVDHGNF
jgi:hypothetical protein